MTDVSKEAVEQLSRDCIAARDCIKDTDTFQTGQSILDEAATVLTALQARVTELEGAMIDIQNRLNGKGNQKWIPDIVDEALITPPQEGE